MDLIRRKQHEGICTAGFFISCIVSDYYCDRMRTDKRGATFFDGNDNCLQKFGVKIIGKVQWEPAHKREFKMKTYLRKIWCKFGEWD